MISLLTTSLLLLTSSLFPLTSPLVTTSLGQIQGVSRANVDAYLGIPYAMAPVDDLLFRSPVPVTGWDTILDATHGGNNCVQESSAFSATHQSRDCLCLNVYVPHHRSLETLPVIVWYHGGSYATGGTGAHTDSTLRQDMSVFAQRMHAVVVTVNYRLNLFGYLYLTPFDSRFQSNCGLRDQLLALKWVNQHIGAFSGNKHNITIMGQSAGAGSVMAIMAVSSANSLYDRVILMSPPPTSFLSPDEAIERTNKYLRLANIDPHYIGDVFALTDEEIRKLNHQFMIRVVMSGDVRCAFSPVVDDELLTKFPMQGALQCHKPMLIGYVSHETELFGEDFPKSVLPFIAKLLHVDVPANEEKERVPFAERFFGELSRQMFFSPIDSFYNAYRGPKQKYFYSYTTPEMDSLGLHCCHSYEMPVIFGWDTPICNANNPRTIQVGDSICQEWRRFILGKSGK